MPWLDWLALLTNLFFFETLMAFKCWWRRRWYIRRSCNLLVLWRGRLNHRPWAFSNTNTLHLYLSLGSLPQVRLTYFLISSLKDCLRQCFQLFGTQFVGYALGISLRWACPWLQYFETTIRTYLIKIMVKTYELKGNFHDLILDYIHLYSE